MNEQLKEKYNKLNTVKINRDDYHMILTDRLDFGFDSIYFRYAELCDEIAMYKAIFNHTDSIQERKNMDGKKMHFYKTLEQLIHAHDKGEK